MPFLPNDDAREPPLADERGESTRNAGQTAYRVEPSRIATRLLIGGWLGSIVGFVVTFVGMNTGLLHDAKSFMVVIGVFAAVGAFMCAFGQRAYRCSDVTCRALVAGDASVCAACGSSFAGTIKQGEWRRLQEEEFERNATAMDVPDCADCKPEEPCAVHAVI
jgi:hypothetical protein